MPRAAGRFLFPETYQTFVRKSIDIYRTNVYNPIRTNVLNNRMVIRMKEKRRHHYRIANPVRFFVFIFICTMILSFAAFTVLGSGRAEASSARTYAQVTVSEDDTLWGLIEKYNPDGRVSVRSAIYDVCEINDIDAGDINPGDKLFIPVY